MQDNEDEGMTFVNLLEEHKDILGISQIPEHKKKKKETAELFIAKWESVCGKKLSQAALFKKVNNIKNRCKLAVTNKKPLASWQLKFVELTAHGEQKLNTESTEPSDDTLEVDRTTTAAQVSKYETDETVSLNNEQLQRLVLLKQLRVANLQLKKMEQNSENSDNSSEIHLDFVGWDGEVAVEAFEA